MAKKKIGDQSKKLLMKTKQVQINNLNWLYKTPYSIVVNSMMLYFA